MTENAQKVLNQIVEDTAKEAVVFHMVEQTTGIFDSKIGGKAYLPENAEYPYCTEEGMENQPLVLLCQLNLDKMPEYRNLPKKGMLQFFIAPDYFFGCDFNDCTSQKGFRIVYYDEIIYDESKLKEPPIVSYDKMPFTKELLITFQKERMPLSSLNDEFSEALEKAEATTGIQLTNEEFCDVSDALFDMATYSGLCENLCYCQGDPRPAKYPELLLQIDSDYSGETGIMWGDAGTAHFFIAPDKLINKDFTEVYYQWDCG